VSLFCRHNRLTANCPICSRELAAERQASAPARPARVRASPSSGTQRRSPGVVTKRVARAADDGYRNPLVPGLRATADAERLAVALTRAAERIAPPGQYPVVAEEPDLEQATWLAFLLALAGPEAPELQEALRTARPRWGDGVAAELPPERARTAEAYRAWVQRAGTQEAAFTGEAAWSPERRFGRLFERLALPGFGRARRFDLLTALGAAGRYELAADGLHLVEDDAATLAAKRLLVSGDRMLLDRRARDLAEACELPVGALDRALAEWGTSGAPVDRTAEVPGAVRAALGLR
jgi:alpha-glutamyl/putrescinyl thymine pyrophosphorylase-like protein